MKSQPAPGQPTQVVILAGGLGTRLRPITEKIPKPLVEVCGAPFLDWQLREVLSQGYKRVLLLVGYLGQMIKSHYGQGEELGMQIDYSVESEPAGTGGALKLALPKLDPVFFVLNGDSFQRLDMPDMARSFAKKSENVRAMVSAYDNSTPTPVINNLKIADDLVTDYRRNAGVENGYGFVDSGVYILNRAIVEDFTQTKFQLEQLWPDLIRKKSLASYRVTERFYDIGSAERLQEFERKISDYFPNAI